MKKKKNKGCIYWDESSRGVSIDIPRGRWVGERLENGKRVRRFLSGTWPKTEKHQQWCFSFLLKQKELWERMTI
jgi:hypothetical protein